MQKLFFFLPACIIAYLLISGQTYEDSNTKYNGDPVSSRIRVTGEYAPLPQNHYRQFTTDYRKVIVNSEMLSISPNFQVHSSFGTQKVQILLKIQLTYYHLLIQQQQEQIFPV